MIKQPPDRQNQPPLPTPAKDSRKRLPPPPKDAATMRLLVDAEAFLRLGLVDKAIAHLSSALDREPSLRGLREPLLKLYLAQRNHPKAIQELRLLLTSCTDVQDEIRYLRFLQRLGGLDKAAEARLKRLLSQQPGDAASISAEFVHPEAAENSLSGSLREYLAAHRPSTDLDRTQNLFESNPQVQSELQAQSAATTNPDGTRVEEVAEEMAYHNGTLKEELDAVDEQLAKKEYAVGLGLVLKLRERYPHAKRVRDKLLELQALPGAAGLGVVIRMALAEPKPSPGSADLHGAVTLPPKPRESEVPVGSKPRRRKAAGERPLAPGESTLEVEPHDIKEERPAAPPRSLPPPPPNSLPGQGPESGMPRAYAAASTLRLAGKYEEALAQFHQASSDPKFGVAAVRMIGMCLRDLDRLDDALLAFTKAINLPQASDSELTELYYELGVTYEQLKNRTEAILYFQLSLGSRGNFRDATDRIARLRDAILSP